MLPVEIKGQCSKGNQCSFLHESNVHAPKPTPKAGGVTLSYVCPHRRRYPLEDHTWWSHQGTVASTRGRISAACGGQYDWRHANSILVIQDITYRREANLFRAHAAPHGKIRQLGQTHSKLLARARQQVERFSKKEADER